MRVLMLNYEYPPLGGGAGNATQELLRVLAREPGLTVDLVTSAIGAARVERPSEQTTLYFEDIGKRGGLHYQSNLDLIRYSMAAWRRCKALMGLNTYDVVHAFFGIPCGVLVNRIGLPYIVSLRGSDVPFYNPRFRQLDRWVFRHLSRRVWRGSCRTVANSAGLRTLALTSSPRQLIEVIPNGVDTDRYHPGGLHNGQNGPLRLLSVGRLIPRKGFHLLLRAMSAQPGLSPHRDW